MIRSELYWTRVGERRFFYLGISKSLELNTNSGARLVTARDAHHLFLTKGEAAVQIASSVLKPIVLSMGDVTVIASNATFCVRRYNPRLVKIFVLTGNVEIMVASATTLPSRLERVASASAATILPGGMEVRSISSKERWREVAWRDDKIVLDGRTVGEAVEEFNRYHNRKILVEESALRYRRTEGVVSRHEPRIFVNLLKETYGLKGVRVRQGLLLRSWN